MVVALFFAVVLNPAVDFLEQPGPDAARPRRPAIVILVAFAALAAPALRLHRARSSTRASEFADDLPGFVEDARNGEGTIGELVERYELEEWVEENQDRLRDFAANLGTPALGVLRSVFTGVAAALTILVLTVLHAAAGPEADRRRRRRSLPERHRAAGRARGHATAPARSPATSAATCSSASSPASSTWIVLSILGVPYAGVLALWVGFTDLIPLVGATIGAVPTVGFAFLHSVTAGIVAAHLLHRLPAVREPRAAGHGHEPHGQREPAHACSSASSIAVELFGLLGALLAIPGAGVIQVVVRDLYDERQRPRSSAEPTVGRRRGPGRRRRAD